MNNSNNNKQWAEMFEQLPLEPTAREEHRQQLKIQVLDAFDNSSPASVSKLKQIGHTIMKYKMPQLTAVAIAIVVAVSTFNFGGTAFAIENVVAKLVNAKSARWETEVDLGAMGKQVIKTSIIDGRTRNEMQDGSVTILDWKSGKGLSLLSASKTALRMTMGEQSKGLDSFNVFQSMRDVLADSLESDGVERVQELGDKTIDGRKLKGFRVDGQQQITIWADPVTEVAVQIEMQMDASQTSVVMKNYEADFAIDHNLFSLEIPDGYQATEVNLPTGLPTEAEFIRSLRLSCECSDGNFPDGLDIKTTSKQSSKVMMHLMKSMELEGSGATGEQIEELTRASMGFAFVTLTVNTNKSAYYAGANVKLGQKDRPIFWYKPDGSDKYRVVYADLSVKLSETAPTVDGAVKLSN